MCRTVGLDLARDPIPVGPAAHYLMGGVETDEWGRTSLPGLFAAGEAACTGVHGANRLASNSLLEGLVFGARAGDGDAAAAPRRRRSKADRTAAAGAWHQPPSRPPAPTSDIAASDRGAVRDLMWRVGRTVPHARRVCRTRSTRSSGV